MLFVETAQLREKLENNLLKGEKNTTKSLPFVVKQK